MVSAMTRSVVKRGESNTLADMGNYQYVFCSLFYLPRRTLFNVEFMVSNEVKFCVLLSVVETECIPLILEDQKNRHRLTGELGECYSEGVCRYERVHSVKRSPAVT